jgi:hypothetical protein
MKWMTTLRRVKSGRNNLTLNFMADQNQRAADSLRRPARKAVSGDLGGAMTGKQPVSYVDMKCPKNSATALTVSKPRKG